MSDEPTQKKTPDFNVYSKVPDGQDTKLGSQIGVAWKHSKSEGLNIVLNAMPIPFNGRAELVAFAVKKDNE